MGVEVWREYHLHTAAQSNKSPRVFLTSGYSCTRFFKENKYRNDVFLSGAKPKLMLKLTAFSVGRAVRNTVCMLLHTPQAVIFCCLLTSAAALNLYEQTGSCAAALLPAQLFFLLQSSANWPFFSPPTRPEGACFCKVAPIWQFVTWGVQCLEPGGRISIYPAGSGAGRPVDL